MSLSKPLSYDALKSVIRHLPNDFRLKINAHVPGVRTAERAVPMKLDTLRFDRNEFTMDDVSYDLGVICESKHGERIPSELQDQNDIGGCKLELDKYGQEIGDSENTLLPGDYQLFEQIYENECPRNDYSFRLFYQPRAVRAELPSFKQFIQLKITRKSKEKTTIIKADYDIKLYEAMKKLTRLFFGGRTTLIVRRLEITELRRLVLRLPVGFKVKIEELAVGSDFLSSVQNSIFQMLDESSFPLKSLEIVKFSIVQPGFKEILDHDIFRHTQELVFRWLCHTENNGDFTNISHRNVFVRNYIGTERKFILFVDKWRKKYLPVGTKYCFATCEDTCVELLKLAESRNGARRECDRLVVLPMSYSADLHISYEKNYRRSRSEHLWILKVEVIENPDALKY